jgi:hypothetical protein
MFLAPFSVPPSLRKEPKPPPRQSLRRACANAALVAWLIVGSAVLLLVPAARGGHLLGATLPFWLVAAPLVDLAWIGRQRIAARLQSSMSALRNRRLAPRNVRRQRLARSAACSAARS